MNDVRASFWKIAILSILAFLPGARASEVTSGKIHPYVLYFEGQLDLDSSELSKAYDRVFEDLDSKRIIKERVKKGVIGSRFYTLEAFVEASSEKDIDYVDNYASSHPFFEIADKKIPLRQAADVVALEMLTGYGPDQNGLVREWGTFSRLLKFTDVGAYNLVSFDSGATLGGGTIAMIQKALPSLLSPMDAYLFNSWFEGVGPEHHKPSRISWNSSSFFEMKDGTYVNRALFFKLDRKLTSMSTGKSGFETSLRQGFEFQ